MLSIVFWDWLRDSESGSRTKRIVGIVFGGLGAARQSDAICGRGTLPSPSSGGPNQGVEMGNGEAILLKDIWPIEKPPATTRFTLGVGTAGTNPSMSG